MESKKSSSESGMVITGRTLIGFSVAGSIIFGLLGFIGLFAIAFSVRGALVMTLLMLPVLSSLGMAIIFLKVVLDRLDNEEDEYYSRNVER